MLALNHLKSLRHNASLSKVIDNDSIDRWDAISHVVARSGSILILI